MEKRCDQYQHCDDFSDETNCKLVVFPNIYVHDYAPFSINNKNYLEKVSVKIKVFIVTKEFLTQNNFS